MVEDDSHGSHELRSFGRRRGRKLSPHQQALLDGLLPQLAVDLKRAPDLQIGRDGMPVWLEIGFGGSEHLIWQAERNPSVQLIGCEPFEDGVVKALGAIDAKALTNVLLHADDARAVLRWLPAACLDRCFILFPDPWPKKRHAKRRLITPSMLALLARVMKPAAELRIGTDIGDYARTVLLAMRTTPQFQWEAAGPRDWRVRPDDWPETRYEAKAAREGRCRYYLRFRRTPELLAG